jgi:hypothetical protein
MFNFVGLLIDGRPPSCWFVLQKDEVKEEPETSQQKEKPIAYSTERIESSNVAQQLLQEPILLLYIVEWILRSCCSTPSLSSSSFVH